jgi:hypothetical protein
MYLKGIAVTVALALTASFCLTLPSWTVRSSAAPRPPADEAAFRNKVILVRCLEFDSVVMEKVKVRQLGERTFLVGKVVEAGQGSGQLKGKSVWQNLDHVLQIIECENVDEAKQTLKSLPGAEEAVPVVPAVPLPGGKLKE